MDRLSARDYKKQCRRLEKRLYYWTDMFLLHEWTVGAEYLNEDIPGDDIYEPGSAVADVTVSSCYLDVKLRFDMRRIATLSDNMVDYVIVHELFHVRINEMRQWGDSNDGVWHEERVVTGLTDLLFRVRDEHSK